MTDAMAFHALDASAHEKALLAPYAMRGTLSRGRRHPEAPHAYRGPYQRDRDRIIHSAAFRRLMYKTQVLAAQTDDYHRTRLTHTLEVAQISRTIARQLGLNEDLTEAIALAHDLGHPPFGHAGEETLNDCMGGHGGFEHNLHGLHIVEYLELRYPDHPGLNLSLEVLEAFASHGGRGEAPEIQEFHALGQPLLEAQVVDAADSLAYDAHDVDDALCLGLVSLEEVAGLAFWRQAHQRALQKHPNVGPSLVQAAVVRSLIDWQVGDLLSQTRARLTAEKIATLQDVRQCPRIVVVPSPEIKQLKTELEGFLHERVYRHPRVVRLAAEGQRMLQALFAQFCRRPTLLPQTYRQRADNQAAERAVCDYLASMTDRFARQEYLRLFQGSAAL
jgi:dGTPase